MRRRKVNLISITQEIEDTPTGQMIRSIIAIFDQYTSEEISKHVKRTLRENAAQGFHCGGVTPFGYRAVFAERRGGREKKKLEVHPEDATVVRLIFDLYRSGGGNSGVMGVKRVTEWLNDHGHRTRSEKLWSIRQIHDMLTDPVYTGRFVFGRKGSPEEQITVPVPPIIDTEIFNAVAAELQSRNPKALPPRVVTGPVLLTGLAKCPKCGGGLTTTTGKGGRYRYYSCATKIRKGAAGCPGFSASMPKVDERVLDGVLTNLLSPSKLTEMLSRLRAQDTAKDAVRAEKLGGFQDAQQAAEDRLRRLYSAIEKGVVDLDDPTLRAIIAAAQRERDDAKAAVETLTRDHQPETPISPEKSNHSIVAALALSADIWGV